MTAYGRVPAYCSPLPAIRCARGCSKSSEEEWRAASDDRKVRRVVLGRVGKKACENDGMVVKERGEIFYPSHEHPGNSGSRVYQEEQGKTLGATYGSGGEFNGPGQKNARDTVLVLVS